MTGCHFLLNLSIFKIHISARFHNFLVLCSINVVSMFICYLVMHTKLSAIDKCSFRAEKPTLTSPIYNKQSHFKLLLANFQNPMINRLNKYQTENSKSTQCQYLMVK